MCVTYISATSIPLCLKSPEFEILSGLSNIKKTNDLNLLKLNPSNVCDNLLSSWTLIAGERNFGDVYLGRNTTHFFRQEHNDVQNSLDNILVKIGRRANVSKVDALCYFEIVLYQGFKCEHHADPELGEESDKDSEPIHFWRWGSISLTLRDIFEAYEQQAKIKDL